MFLLANSTAVRIGARTVTALHFIRIQLLAINVQVFFVHGTPLLYTCTNLSVATSNMYRKNIQFTNHNPQVTAEHKHQNNPIEFQTPTDVSLRDKLNAIHSNLMN